MSYNQGPGPSVSQTANDPVATQSYVNNLTMNSVTFPYTTVATDIGTCIYSGSGTNTVTIGSGYATNAMLSFVNMSANAMTIASASDTVYLAGLGSTGNRTLGQYGVATAVKMPGGAWIISGVNLT